MKCSICSIECPEVIQEIEYLLEANEGILTAKNKIDLAEKYPAYKNNIANISDQDCNMHWNFHQSVARVMPTKQNDKVSGDEKNGSSFAEDIDKDEASVLYELLNEQAATFRCLSRKINRAIEKLEPDSLNQMLIHPNTSIMYKDLSDSIRATSKAILEMNNAVNGSKDGALSGLKALAQALTQPANTENDGKAEPTSSTDLTTDEYDY